MVPWLLGILRGNGVQADGMMTGTNGLPKSYNLSTRSFLGSGCFIWSYGPDFVVSNTHLASFPFLSGSIWVWQTQKERDVLRTRLVEFQSLSSSEECLRKNLLNQANAGSTVLYPAFFDRN
ncbi:hypothetical protein BDBG_16776 [Blastomyces gilchristii SLH14081]|uniref:Uncharacterized protein n=1 Tax=Blastomyces gilchristii (strain SLH14081) TaxID=559298 RepID=A0A179UIV8_BLAGS|nr:uncharacterized protein BDBG_16776 [Blastomyces gilchristii SLH14081]OAT07159.1 hypothetical protein BDBG_16776 [Blastomyces gilchristii SLH14081]